METRNAKIKSTFLGIEDHGIMTCSLQLEGDSWGQGFGNYSFGGSKKPWSGFGIEAIAEIIEAVGVESWEKLPGTTVRVRREGHNDVIHSIGHIIKDQWVSLKEIAERFKTD